MKKFISVILMISFILLTLIGCNNTDTPADDTTAPTFVDVIKDYDKIDDSSTEGFTVKAKKYDYEENNIVLLSVENQTESNYTVTVDMIYYDDGGNEIIKESQSFEGFAANWQKYFMFKPDRAFSSYEYKITTEDFDGECYGNTITYKYDGVEESRAHLGVDENGNDKGMGKAIWGRIPFKYEYPGILDILYYGIIFDNKGEICAIGSGMSYMESPYIEQSFSIKLVLGTKDSVEWPENLKGETAGIFILDKMGVGIFPPPKP